MFRVCLIFFMFHDSARNKYLRFLLYEQFEVPPSNFMCGLLLFRIFFKAVTRGVTAMLDK